MAIKIENQASTRAPQSTTALIEAIINSVPREHLRGVDRIRLVEFISDPRLKALTQRNDLPGLYHPRQGSQGAWLEVALGVLLPAKTPFYKRFMPRLSFKGNLAAVLFSLIGQHYYLTLRHSVKKGQIEVGVRNYAEKYLKLWQERQQGVRYKLLKPFQPTFERWGRALQKRVSAEQKKRQAT